MPGRVSTRSSLAGKSATKSSLSSLKSRSSAPAIPDEGPTTDLRTRISSIFADAQRSTTGHRKLVVSLRKIHEACCYESDSRTEYDAFDEADFNGEVARCVLRLLPVKKTESAADRVVKFFGLFLRHASEKDAALVQDEIAEGEVVETPTSRLSSALFQMLLPLLSAKEKVVRYRATQIVSFMVNCLDSLDDEYYHLVKAGLAKRMKDKEAMVRVQAALGLGRLAGNEGGAEQEEDDSEDEDAAGLLEKLIDSLQNDPNADVRKSLLLNLPLTPTTLPYLLERARDLDPATRRALYARLLPALGDFRHLSLSMREKLLRWGLRDRDEHVRKATARLFRERWIEDCAGIRDEEGNRPAELPPPSIDALLELLERIDIVNSGIENGIALEAMKEFWDGRPDYREAVNFDNDFWDNLTAESVFLVRSLNEFCQQDESRYALLLEEKMPEVTKLGFYLERYLNALAEKLRAVSDPTAGENEEDTVEQEFIVEQLLHVAYTLDYSDEVGRRKMFSLLRESLAIPELPEEITKLSIEVLRLVCGKDAAGEREFCGIVLEAVAEIHDTIALEDSSDLIDEDESFHSAKSAMSTDTVVAPKPDKPLLRANPEEDEEKAIKEIMVNMKCLHIAQCMLQNVAENLKENVHLVTMLNNLVVPAVRSHEAPIRERGLLCLGLCCLLDKSLADENLTLFVHCFNKGHPALQVTSLHVLCDILSTHPSILSPTTNPDSSIQQHPLAKPITKAFTKAIKTGTAPEVQAAAVVSLCKLLLTRVLVDPDLLKALITLFFDPTSRENAAARQALSYFLPAFAHSRRENMELLASVAPGVMHSVVSFQDDLEEDDEAVSTLTVGTMLVEWTDVRRLVTLDEPLVHDFTSTPAAPVLPNGDIHASLALTLLERIQASACTKEERKALLLMLGKLYINSNSDIEKLQAVKERAEDVGSGRIVADATSRNSLAKLVTAVEKALAVHEDADDSRSIRKRSKSKMVDEETENDDQAGEETEKEESHAKVVVKREESLPVDESSILDSSRVDNEGDTIMEM